VSSHQFIFMQATTSAKPKVAQPPVDSSRKYILALLILGAIVVCTRVHVGFIGEDRETINLQITSRIGKEHPGAASFKNAISLNLGNPVTTKSLAKVKSFLSGKQELQGEFIGYKYSIAPRNSAKKPSAPDSK
jgi:hypothetical protein